mgnify:CR=1 FL=1
MKIEQILQNKIAAALKLLGVEVDASTIVIERSKEAIHGDFASNIAMQSAKILRKAPRVIAEEIINHLDMSGLTKVEIAGPGFLNFFVETATLAAVINRIHQAGEKYGNGQVGEGKRINVEFVSANPTGDLHLGHARGAALGDSICRLYEAAGFDVTREYYVNDAGNQIDNLGVSLYARYLQALGHEAVLPEDGYYGPDILEIAKVLVNEVGDKYVNNYDARFFKAYGMHKELGKINDDLAFFRVHFDVYSYETEVRKDGRVEKLLEQLKPYTYEDEGATFLKTSDFGDDKDRVIVKSDGAYTYFLPDIVYHLDKLSRNYDLLIDVLGSDHHGYIARMKAALQMFNYPSSTLEVEMLQMVRLIKNGEEFIMSKRSGNAVTLRELCEEVGVDAVRYFFVARASTSHLDFDLDLASEASSANPIYYAQYAYARLFAVLEKGKQYNISYEGAGLTSKYETDLMKELGNFPQVVEDAALSRSPYKITNYVQKLAAMIHAFYTECRLLDESNVPLTENRLGLAEASAIVLKKALNLIGVNSPEKM